MFGLLENKVRLKGGVGPGGEVPEAFHQRLGVLLLQVDSPRRQPRRKGIELSYSDRALRAVQQVFPGPLFIEYRLRRLLDSPGRSEEHTSELQSLMRISYAVFFFNKK